MASSIFKRNIAWVAERTQADPDLFKNRSTARDPRILWIGCSDNPTPGLEMAAFEDEGCLVHRNLCNQVSAHDQGFLATLSYALQIRSVERIVICGHYGCRCLRDILHDSPPAATECWLGPIRGLCRANRRQLDEIISEDAQIQTLCELNVREQVRNLAEHPLIESRLAVGSLRLEGAIWSGRDGLLRDPGISAARPSRPSRRTRSAVT